MSEVTNMTKGVYRRVYAGFILGRRINAISLEAEAWFWRMHAVADDFGNLPADPVDVRALTQGRREVTVTQIQGWVSECVSVGLMQQYEAEGQQFLHIDGFEGLQPLGRNGRPLMRYPRPGESGGIRGNPGESRRSHIHSHIHSHQHQQQDAGPRAADADDVDSRRVMEELIGKPWLIGKRKATSLVQQHGEGAIRAAMRLASKPHVKNPGGLLISVLENGEAAEEAANGHIAPSIPASERRLAVREFREAFPVASLWSDEQVIKSRMFAEWFENRRVSHA